jgi:4-amino-4-deoxy-L-arabinose transferase-like glycosyltransferase
VAVLVLHTAYTRDFRPWRRASIASGLPLFLALTVPWHWLAARRLPDFLEFFFVHEHLARYLTPSADRQEPAWFFIAVMVAGTLPWTLAALRALATGWRRRPMDAGFDVGVFVWIWVIFVVGFFSLSDSKLIPYVLPALPGLALLVAVVPEPVWQRDVSMTAGIALVTALALLGAAFYGPRFVPATARGQCFLPLFGSLPAIAALFGASGAFVLLSRHRDSTRDTVLLGAGGCLAVLLIARAAAAVAPIYSGATIALSAGALSPTSPIYTLQTYDQTLPFYWRRTVELVSYRGELDYGLTRDPSAQIGDVAQFLAQWRALPEGYALMENRLFEKLTASGVPMREIAHDVNRVLVARR